MELVKPSYQPSPDEARARLAAALGQVATGDRRAFYEVYQRSAAKLYGICCRILGDGQDAEDALQEAFVNVWRRADRFDADRASPITWLAAIARNAAIDRLRARGNRSFTDLDAAAEVADDAPDAEQQALAGAEQLALGRCLGELAGRDQGLIRAAFLEGATYPELAQRAGEPLGTIKSRIRRALLRLRDCLGR